jgi:CTP synthase
LNPSPPFLGFVAAACGPEVFTKQLEVQEKTYVPPHPAAAMVSEEELRNVVGAVPTASGKEHMQVVQAINQDF